MCENMVACVEIIKKQIIFLFFLSNPSLFHFLYVILGRASQKRTHYIFAQIVFRISTSQNE